MKYQGDIAMRTILTTIFVIGFGMAYAGETKKDEVKDPNKAKIDSALSLMKSKQWDGAKTILEAVIKEDENNLDATVAIAECEDNLKNVGRATELYYKAIELAVAKDNEQFTSTKEGKTVLDKCRKALNRLDEGMVIIKKHADMMEKEAQVLKGKNDFAYEQVMKFVKEMKPEKQQGEKKIDLAKAIVGKWHQSNDNSKVIIDAVGNATFNDFLKGKCTSEHDIVYIKWNNGTTYILSYDDANKIKITTNSNVVLFLVKD